MPRLYVLLAILYMVGFVIWLANRSILFPDSFDTALYHLQATRWSFEYPAIPGLGNVHSRLAFSNGYFLYPALLNTGFWFERTYHITAGLLYSVMMTQIVVASINLLRGEWRMYRAYYALYFPVIWFLFLTDRTVPSITNDAPLFPLGIIISAQLLMLVSRDDLTEKQAFYQVMVIVLLACVGVAIKFSFIVLGGLTAAFALLYVLWKHSYQLKWVMIAVGIATFVLIPMMGRSVIMTGYPLYPLDVFAFDVDWRMPDFWPARESQIIRSWAYGLPDGQTDPFTDFGWMNEWSKSLLYSYFHVLTAFGLAGLGALSLIWTILWRKQSAINIWWFAPVVAAFGGIVFWFLSAPLLRFIGALPWIVGLGLFVIGLTVAQRDPAWRKRVFVMVFVILCVPPLRLLVREPWIEPGPNDGLYYLPFVEAEPYITDYGVDVGIPVVFEMCFDSPLPCAPFVSPQLQYRDEDGDLSSGFRVAE